MPRKPPHPCGHPGCPNLTYSPRCEQHTVQRAPWTGSRRSERITGSRWAEQQARQRILTAYAGICHVCGQPGADQVDHVLALAEGGTDTDDNKRPIHHDPCHKRKTQAEAARARWPGRTPRSMP